MGYNIVDSIKIFKTNFVLFFVLISFPVSRCTNISTICYGTPGLSCTLHKLSCPSSLVIQIINTSYGYRPGCNEYIGIPNCDNTTCCNEKPGDCFIPFSSDEYKIVAVDCNKKEMCTIAGTREISSTGCGGTASAYSKIQYDCVMKGSNITTSTQTTDSGPNTKSPTGIKTIAPETQYSTDLTSTSYTAQCPQFPVAQSDNSGVVGGVLGTLLIISVIINVGLVVYFTRKMKSLSSIPRENNYDGITNIGRDQPPTTYDDLQVQSTASSNHDDKKQSDSSHTYYNTKGDSLSRDIDPYYENMKRP